MDVVFLCKPFFFSGVAVVQLNATDLDFDGKANLEYEIADGNKDGKFKINSKTGLITVNESRNLAGFYRLKVSILISVFYCKNFMEGLCSWNSRKKKGYHIYMVYKFMIHELRGIVFMEVKKERKEHQDFEY